MIPEQIKLNDIHEYLNKHTWVELFKMSWADDAGGDKNVGVYKCDCGAYSVDSRIEGNPIAVGNQFGEAFVAGLYNALEPEDKVAIKEYSKYIGCEHSFVHPQSKGWKRDGQ